MRAYDHPVDEAFVLQRLGTPCGANAIDDGPLIDLLLVHDYVGAIDAGVQTVGLAWAAGEPAACVRDRLAKVVTWIGEALRRGETPNAADASRWLEIALLAGADDTAERVAALVRGGQVPMYEVPAVLRWHLHALLALIRRDRRTAKEAAGAMRQWLADSTTDERLAEDFRAIDAMTTAVASGDQARFDAATATRRRHVVEVYSRSRDQGRWVGGLLDLRAAALAATARRTGLELPVGDTYLATDLVIAHRPLGVVVRPQTRRRVTSGV